MVGIVLPGISPKVVSVFEMIRPHIVAGGLLAFFLGALLAMLDGAAFSPARLVLGYLVISIADLSTHYSNDYFDAGANSDIERDKAFGGSRVLYEHPELRPLARSIAIALMLLSVTLAVIFVLLCGAPGELLAIAIGANLLGWFYSALPLRLSARGLGEIAIALGTGLLIPGTGYLVARGQFDPPFLLFAMPFTMYGFMLSLSLEVPDMEDDIRVGKNNLVVRKGRRFAFSAIGVLSSLATIAFLIYAEGLAPPTIIDFRIVAAISCIPLAAGLVGLLRMPDKREGADRLSAVNITALFLFNVFMDIYATVLLLT
jgi:1,4-dihydroxy-2-naphthoate octaprenyltransferase